MPYSCMGGTVYIILLPCRGTVCIALLLPTRNGTPCRHPGQGGTSIWHSYSPLAAFAPHRTPQPSDPFTCGLHIPVIIHVHESFFLSAGILPRFLSHYHISAITYSSLIPDAVCGFSALGGSHRLRVRFYTLFCTITPTPLKYILHPFSLLWRHLSRVVLPSVTGISTVFFHLRHPSPFVSTVLSVYCGGF